MQLWLCSLIFFFFLFNVCNFSICLHLPTLILYIPGETDTVTKHILFLTWLALLSLSIQESWGCPPDTCMLNCENCKRNNFFFFSPPLPFFFASWHGCHQNTFLNAGWKKLLSDLALQLLIISNKGSYKKHLERFPNWRSEARHLFPFYQKHWDNP